MKFFLLFLAGLHGSDVDEERTVNADLQELASSSSASFWSHASSARVLLTLHNHVKQVSGVMVMCHAALLNAYTAIDRKSVV